MKRVDANQAVIVAVLRAAGASVFDTHELGHGYPDLTVGFFGRNYLIEIKSPGGRYTDAEVKFFENGAGMFTKPAHQPKPCKLSGLRSMFSMGRVYHDKQEGG